MAPRNESESVSTSVSIATSRVVPSSYGDDENLEFFEETLRKAISIEKDEVRAKDSDERDRLRLRLKKLVADRSDKLVKNVSSSKDQNFLHFLAQARFRFPNSAEVNSTVQKLVARMLLQKGGMDMLLAVDANNNTPIHTALTENGHSFLIAISGAPSQPETIEKVRQTLEKNKSTWAHHQTKSTFLHAAVTSRVVQNDNGLLLAIIALAPDAMLRAADINGCTPLHLAVEHSRCTAGRFDIISELVSRDPSVLMKRDKDQMSVYQHFVCSKPATTPDSIDPNISNVSRGSLGRQASPVSSTPSVVSSITRGSANVTEETSKRIGDLLLLESMRIMSCEIAQRSLHVPDQPGMI